MIENPPKVLASMLAPLEIDRSQNSFTGYIYMVAAYRVTDSELFEYSHSDRVAAESVEDVGGAGEVEHELVRARVRDAVDLRRTATVS
jgi:hypothetical protein